MILVLPVLKEKNHHIGVISASLPGLTWRMFRRPEFGLRNEWSWKFEFEEIFPMFMKFLNQIHPMSVNFG